MESFQVTLHLEDRVCYISGTDKGLEFMDQEEDLTPKFIKFCTGKSGISVSDILQWKVNFVTSAVNTLSKWKVYNVKTCTSAVNTLDLNTAEKEILNSDLIESNIVPADRANDRNVRAVSTPRSDMGVTAPLNKFSTFESAASLNYENTEDNSTDDNLKKSHTLQLKDGLFNDPIIKPDDRHGRMNVEELECDNCVVIETEIKNINFRKSPLVPNNFNSSENKSVFVSKQDISCQGKIQSDTINKPDVSDTINKSDVSDTINTPDVSDTINKPEVSDTINTHDVLVQNSTHAESQTDTSSKTSISHVNVRATYFMEPDHTTHSSEKTCPLCNALCANTKLLHGHIKRIHKKHLFCGLCGTIFTAKSHYVEHRVKGQCVATQQEKFLCKSCGVYLYNSRSLYRHHVTVHKTKVSVCRYCGECFENRRTLDNHLDVTHVKTSTCVICKETFQERVEFKGQMSLTRTRTMKTCARCSAVNLKDGRHDVIFPYTCDVCGKWFKVKDVLTTHMASHSNVRPYQCETCGSCFKVRSTLYAHKRTHINEKLHKCRSCDKEFRSTDGLKNHQIKCHMTEEELKTYRNKIYTCEHCGQMTGQKHVHIRHVRSHTGEKPFTCDHCQKAFPTVSKLNIHRKKHGNHLETCDICQINFWEKSKYKRHLMSKKHRIQSARSESISKHAQTTAVDKPILIAEKINKNDVPTSSSTYFILPDNLTIRVVDTIGDGIALSGTENITGSQI